MYTLTEVGSLVSGMFEVLAASESEEQIARQEAADKLAAAVYDVRQEFGDFLFKAASVHEFRTRVALVKDDMMKVVARHLPPVSGVMGRIATRPRAAILEKEFRTRLADFQKGAPSSGNENDGRLHGPFAGYSDWEDCTSENSDKGDSDAYCGKIYHQVEDGRKRKGEPLTNHQDKQSARYLGWFGTAADEEGDSEQGGDEQDAPEGPPEEVGPAAPAPEGPQIPIGVPPGPPDQSPGVPIEQPTVPPPPAAFPEPGGDPGSDPVTGEPGPGPEPGEQGAPPDFHDPTLRDDLMQAEGDEIKTIGEYGDYEQEAEQAGDPEAAQAFGDVIGDEQEHARAFNDVLDSEYAHQASRRRGYNVKELRDWERSRAGSRRRATGDGGAQEIHPTYQEHQGQPLIPEGNWQGFQNRVDQSSGKVDNAFAPGEHDKSYTRDPADTNFVPNREARTVIQYLSFCHRHNLAPTLRVLERHGKRLSAADYLSIAAALDRFNRMPTAKKVRVAQLVHMVTFKTAAPDYLQKAMDALTGLLNQKAEDFQSGIAPLQQALQVVQQSKAMEQATNPMSVTPPAGTVNVLPGDPSGGGAMPGMDPSGGGMPPMPGMDPAAAGGAPADQSAPPPAAAAQGAPPDPTQQMAASRKRGKTDLTNVRIEDHGAGLFSGQHPAGHRVVFRTSPEDAQSLRDVMHGDLAQNFSGVSVDNKDIVNEHHHGQRQGGHPKGQRRQGAGVVDQYRSWQTKRPDLERGGPADVEAYEQENGPLGNRARHHLTQELGLPEFDNPNRQAYLMACRVFGRQLVDASRQSKYTGGGEVEDESGPFAGGGDSFPVGTEKDLNDAKSVCNMPSVRGKHPGTCDKVENMKKPARRHEGEGRHRDPNPKSQEQLLQDYARTRGENPDSWNTFFHHLTNPNKHVQGPQENLLTRAEDQRHVASRKQSWMGWGPAQVDYHPRVAGWDWDHHLEAYTSKRPGKFACSCGNEMSMPGHHECRCGRLYNGYVIGTGGQNHAAAADKYVVREIPVREGVIVANRKQAAEYVHHGPKNIQVRSRDPQGRDWEGYFGSPEAAEEWGKSRDVGDPYDPIPRPGRVAYDEGPWMGAVHDDDLDDDDDFPSSHLPSTPRTPATPRDWAQRNQKNDYAPHALPRRKRRQPA